MQRTLQRFVLATAAVSYGCDNVGSSPDGGAQGGADAHTALKDAETGRADTGHPDADAFDAHVADSATPEPDAAVDADATAISPDVSFEVPDAAKPELPVPVGDPIEAEAGSWDWVAFEGAVCADGSRSGLGVNLHPGATRALIYFEGGGACWDHTTCAGLIPTAFNLNGFDQAQFENLITRFQLGGHLFDREDQKNVFRDAHLIFIPYCTADAFIGDRVAELDGLFPWQTATIHFKGRRNLEVFLERLIPTLADTEQIVIAGSSAGGFGAGLNWPLFAAAFPEKRVDLIDDSGPPIRPADGLWSRWQTVWGYTPPEACPDCAQDVRAYMAHYVQSGLTQRGRMAVISYDRDTIISVFFQLLPVIFRERLLNLAEAADAVPGLETFIVPGRLHTLLTGDGPALIEASDGTPLWRWLEMMVTDDPAWTSVR